MATKRYLPPTSFIGVHGLRYEMDRRFDPFLPQFLYPLILHRERNSPSEFNPAVPEGKSFRRKAPCQ